jgi:hypothetical protein
VPHLVGGLWLQHHADLEDELIRAYEVPGEAASISVAIDRASVPMEEAVPRLPGRPHKNAPKRSVQRAFRMCYCATVTLHDKDGQALRTLRRGRMPGCDPKDLCDMLANDVSQLREKRPDLLMKSIPFSGNQRPRARRVVHRAPATRSQAMASRRWAAKTNPPRRRDARCPFARPDYVVPDRAADGPFGRGLFRHLTGFEFTPAQWPRHARWSRRQVAPFASRTDARRLP